MDEIIVTLNNERIRQPRQEKTTNYSVSLPDFLTAFIDKEAEYQGKTRSYVIAYLIFCGLKAHVGEFITPKDNHIKKLYRENGRSWKLK